MINLRERARPATRGEYALAIDDALADAPGNVDAGVRRLLASMQPPAFRPAFSLMIPGHDGVWLVTSTGGEPTVLKWLASSGSFGPSMQLGVPLRSMAGSGHALVGLATDAAGDEHILIFVLRDPPR